MTTIIPIKPVGRVKLTTENKCGYCTNSTCCTYMTQSIDAPRSMDDFDMLLWQVSHRDVQLFKDEDGWFLLVNNPCLQLLPDGRCGIYETRPQICRDHSNDNCEFHGMSKKDFQIFFDGYDSLLKYCRKRFKNWEKHFSKPEEKKKARTKAGRRK